MKYCITIKRKFKELSLANENYLLVYEFKGFNFVNKLENEAYVALNYISRAAGSKCSKCSKCNSFITRNKGYREHTIRYSTLGDKVIAINFKKKIIYCFECSKQSRTYT